MCIAAVGLAATRGKRLPHKGNWFVDLLISYLVSITLAGTSIIGPGINGPERVSPGTNRLSWPVRVDP